MKSRVRHEGRFLTTWPTLSRRPSYRRRRAPVISSSRCMPARDRACELVRARAHAYGAIGLVAVSSFFPPCTRTRAIQRALFFPSSLRSATRGEAKRTTSIGANTHQLRVRAGWMSWSGVGGGTGGDLGDGQHAPSNSHDDADLLLEQELALDEEADDVFSRPVVRYDSPPLPPL